MQLDEHTGRLGARMPRLRHRIASPAAQPARNWFAPAPKPSPRRRASRASPTWPGETGGRAWKRSPSSSELWRATAQASRTARSLWVGRRSRRHWLRTHRRQPPGASELGSDSPVAPSTPPPAAQQPFCPYSGLADAPAPLGPRERAPLRRLHRGAGAVPPNFRNGQSPRPLIPTPAFVRLTSGASMPA